MRANEFISENRKASRPSKRQSQSSVGMDKFRDADGYDRVYELNRVMMAVASSNGTSPIDVNAESWSGRYNTAHPYTEVEQKMLKQAFKLVGSEYIDLNHGDMHSRELDSTYTKSPVTAFKGFKK